MTNTSPGYITFRIFESFSELLCVFSTRVGGYSRGLFKGQNLGNKKFDQNKLVDKNRQEFFNHFGITETAVAIPEQIHSSGITFVSSAGIIPQTDALITPTPNVFLVVQTADCFPVFIYDPVQKTCAIIHAGWRGAIQNIITETLKKLETFHKSKKSDIYVAVGPGLQQECFEVREDVYRLFPQQYLRRQHTGRIWQWKEGFLPE